MSFYKWSKTAASNATADSTVNWQEGQSPGSVNDSARAMMAATAKYREDMGCAGTTAGTADAYTLATSQVLAAWQNGFTFAFLAHISNLPAATISLDGLAAKKLRMTSGVDMAANEVLIGTLRHGTYLSATDEVLLHAPVDAAAALATGMTPTGTCFDYIGAGAPAGFVQLSGRTMGDALSGGTERANADTVTLYLMLWNSLPDAQAPVISGRGSSAILDYAAHKAITLPDARGRTTVGRDDMGGTAANRITVAGCGVLGTLLGNSGGSETQTLTSAQMPQHSHGVTDPGHDHDYDSPSVHGYNTVGGGTNMYAYTPSVLSTAPGVTGISIQNTGGGGAHPNVQPILVMNKIVKL
jgi:microcystin-dependent protein